MVEKMKPCPWCGGEAIVHQTEYPEESCPRVEEIPKGARFTRSTRYADGHEWCSYRRPAFAPQCRKTDCLGRIRRLFDTEEEAIEAWNKRANEVEVTESAAKDN